MRRKRSQHVAKKCEKLIPKGTLKAATIDKKRIQKTDRNCIEK